MPLSKPAKDFWAKVWREVEPITTHLIVVLALVLSLTIAGLTIIGLSKLLDRIVDNHLNQYVPLIEKIDFWLIIACLVLFGLYTLATVAIRLYKGIKEELTESAAKEQQ